MRFSHCLFVFVLEVMMLLRSRIGPGIWTQISYLCKLIMGRDGGSIKSLLVLIDIFVAFDKN